MQLPKTPLADASRARSPSEQPGTEAARAALLEASPLAGVAEPARGALLELGKVERHARKTRLAHQGDAVKALFLLGSGRVKLERHREGHAVPIAHRGPGETIGEGAALGAPAGETATVVDDVEALVFPMAGFRRLLATEDAVREAMLRLLVQQQREAEDRLSALLLHGVEARIVDFLLRAAARWGRQEGSAIVIDASFTHAEIALLIGSTRETVTLLLGKLRRGKLIALDRRRILIVDRTALAAQAP